MHYELQRCSFISGHYLNREAFPLFTNLQLLEGHLFFHLINTYAVITVFQELKQLERAKWRRGLHQNLSRDGI